MARHDHDDLCSRDTDAAGYVVPRRVNLQDGFPGSKSAEPPGLMPDPSNPYQALYDANDAEILRIDEKRAAAKRQMDEARATIERCDRDRGARIAYRIGLAKMIEADVK